MKKIIICVVMLLGFQAQSQLKVTQYKDALTLAKQSQKLILVDFTASWCGPCQVMKREFWNTQKTKDSLSHFILAEIDVDFNKAVAQKYGVTSIPNVFVIDAYENNLANSTGYEGAESSLKDYLGYPKEVKNLYEALAKYEKDKNVTHTWEVALAFQEASKIATAKGFDALLKQSNSYFDALQKAMKKDKTEISLVNKAYLQQLENAVLDKRFKKIIKDIKLDKIDSTNLAYAHYLLYVAHLGLKEQEEANKNYETLVELNDGIYSEKAKLLNKS